MALDQRTRDIRKEQTGVSERKHRLMQFMRGVTVVGGVALMAMAIHNKQIHKTQRWILGVESGAIAALCLNNSLVASRKRNATASRIFENIAFGDLSDTVHEKAVSDLKHLQEKNQLGSRNETEIITGWLRDIQEDQRIPI